MNLLRTNSRPLSCAGYLHIGILENEADDKAAKHALDLPVQEMGIHYWDHKLHIRN